jgi:hypothetical protein
MEWWNHDVSENPGSFKSCENSDMLSSLSSDYTDELDSGIKWILELLSLSIFVNFLFS